jgi:hypothetical protein
MTDRAKKISELQVTTSVANTDKLVVLKDAANASIATTRSISLSSLAQSLTPLVQASIPNTTVISNSVIVASNGSTPVPFFTYDIGPGKSGCCQLMFHARDSFTNSITGGTLTAVAIGTEANMNYDSVAAIGTNQIGFGIQPLVNAASNTVTLFFARDSATTTNVSIRYTATIF